MLRSYLTINCGTAALLFGLMLAAPAAAEDVNASSGGVGQYISGKAHGSPKILNPTHRTMASLMIRRDEGDGELSSDFPNGSCAVCVSPPKGTDQFCFNDKTNGEDGRSLIQVVSVPLTGEYRFNASRYNLGVIVMSKRVTAPPLRPDLFKLRDAAEVAAVMACLCQELDDEGLSPDLFKNVPSLGSCP